jgi:hypothetical protein
MKNPRLISYQNNVKIKQYKFIVLTLRAVGKGEKKKWWRRIPIILSPEARGLYLPIELGNSWERERSGEGWGKRGEVDGHPWKTDSGVRKGKMRAASACASSLQLLHKIRAHASVCCFCSAGCWTASEFCMPVRLSSCPWPRRKFVLILFHVEKSYRC